MSKQGRIAKGAKKPYRYYPNKTQYEERENILNRVFSASKKNQIWVGDITYIPTRHGFLYLAVFIDIFSCKVTGWSMDTRIKDSLVMSAFYQAIGREHPDRNLKRELVQDANYNNAEQARMDILKYIQTYYNTKRIYSALGSLSPIQFEIQDS
ncbi:MAG: DDE-type integrase/transposase/recombinase [Bacillota bacterium]|nr:DDE-type integrase/transposase/recombinase [Bacillota bacterium]